MVEAKRIGSAGLLKYISGIYHAVEWERACLFFCMAFTADRLVGQVRSDPVFVGQSINTVNRLHSMLSISRLGMKPNVRISTVL